MRSEKVRCSSNIMSRIRAVWVVLFEELWILEEFTVRRFAVIPRKFHSEHSEDDLYWSKSQWDGRKGRAD